MASNSTSNSYRRGGSNQPNRHGRNHNPQRTNQQRRNGANGFQQSRDTGMAAQQESPEGIDVLRNERLVSAIMHMVGNVVQLIVASGRVYEGVLSSISKECHVELKEVTLLPQKDEPGNRETVGAMLFMRSDFIEITATNLDLRGESFTDAAISRANGQALEARPLVAWDGGSESTACSLQLDSADGANGWDADEMFQTNETRFQVKSTYEESLCDYTVPMPQFASKAEQMEAEKRAAEKAREIESSEGYRQRISVENNPEVDEESKYSSVVRPGGDASSPSATRSYVPPGRRQQENAHNQRIAPSGAMSSPHPQPLPQRERRVDRDRADRGHDRGDRGWERNSLTRNSPSASATQAPAVSPVQPKDQDRPNGDRRPEAAGRSYSQRQGHIAGPGHHHGGAPSGAPVSQVPSVGSPVPQHQPSQPHFQGTPSVSVPPNVQQGTSHASPSAPVPSPTTQPGRGNPPSVPATPVNTPQSTASPPPPPPQERVEVQALPPQARQQQQAAVANFQGGDKKSPREKDHRRDQKVQCLRQFKENFNLLDEKVDPQGSHAERAAAADRRPDSHPLTRPAEDVQGATGGVVASTPPQTTSAVPVSTQGPPTPSQGPQTTSQGTTASDPPPATTSKPLNPLATEFKPRLPNQQPAMQGASPGPTTSPSQGPRQSPGMMSHPQAILPLAHHGSQYLVTNVQHSKIMPLTQSHPHGPSKPYQPKRAVVSVDPVALAHNATGPPLTIAQGATLQQQNYLQYNVISQTGQYQPVQMRVLPSMPPQGATMDPTQGHSGQQPHVPQSYLMAHQQPVPAHMPTAQALTQSMPQPAHTLQHHQHIPHGHQTHPSSLPPVSQNQNVPHPSVSPVQHMTTNGHNHGPSGPQMNHNQGAPPTSGTPQPQIAYPHHIPGLPPQGAAPHALPAHSVSQGPNPALQYIHAHQHPLQAGVSFSQAGPTASGGPTPAHIQSNGPMNVVVMPHPPPQAINQAPINSQHQQHQQHVAAAAQFQQHIQGAANQLHGPMGHNQHLLQGHVPGAGAGMAVPQHMQFLPQGLQGSHSHNPHPHSHSVNHGPSHHVHGHPHTHHFQAQ